MHTITKDKTIKTIIIATGLAAALSLYLILKKTSKESLNHARKSLTEKEKKALIRRLKESVDEKGLTPDNVIQILNASIAFASDDFLNQTYERRKERRAVKENFTKYVELAAEHHKANMARWKAQNHKTLDLFGISPEDFRQTMKKFLDEGNQEVTKFWQSLNLRWVERLGSNKKVSVDQFKIILRRQLEIFKSCLRMLPKLKSLLANDDKLIQKVIERKMYDDTALEFGIEEEDIYALTKKYGQLPECKAIMEEFVHVRP